MTIRLRDLILGYLIGFVIAMLGLYLLFTSSMFHEVVQDDNVPLIVVFPEQQNCTEDMDCWDCTTMGNRICGPTDATITYKGDSE